MLYVERVLALGRKRDKQRLEFVKPGDWKEHQDVFPEFYVPDNHSQ